MPDTPEQRTPVLPVMSANTILAFDFGLRRIGVAIGQSVTRSASPLGVIPAVDGQADSPAVQQLVDEWRPQALIVGLPLHADGRPSDLQPAIDAFVASLEPFGLPVVLVDERHSSQEAQRVLRNARAQGIRGRVAKADVDSAAAVVIAERFLCQDGANAVVREPAVKDRSV